MHAHASSQKWCQDESESMATEAQSHDSGVAQRDETWKAVRRTITLDKIRHLTKKRRR